MNTHRWGWLLLVGCARVVEPARPSDPLARMEPGEVLLDELPGGAAVVARVLPPPEDSDGDRVLRPALLTREGRRPWRDDVLEARAIPGTGALLVLTTGHVLTRRATPDGAATELDREVYGPLSLDARGTAVAYTRGDPPALSLVRLDLRTGRAAVMAGGLVPAWCPALSADGTEAVVVASPDGAPALYRVREGEAPRRWELPAGSPLPTGPSAPVVFGDALVFEDESGLHALGLDGSPRRGWSGAHGLVASRDGSTLLTQRGATVLRLGARDLEAPR